MMRRRAASVATVLLLTHASACSLYWTQSADPFVAPNPPLCEPDVLAPSLDAVLTAALAAAAVGYVWGDPRSSVRRQGAIIDGSIAAIFAASGTLGFVRMSRCMEAHDQYRRWLRDSGLPPEGQPGTLRDGPWLNPPVLTEEAVAEKAWQEEQERRFAAERVDHTGALESMRQDHPMVFASLRISNEGGDSTFAVRVRMEDTEEDLQTLDPQTLPAHGQSVYSNALQVRTGVPAEVTLVVRTGPSETVLPLDAALHAGGTLHVTFGWDAAAGRFALQQSWDAAAP